MIIRKNKMNAVKDKIEIATEIRKIDLIIYLTVKSYDADPIREGL